MKSLPVFRNPNERNINLPYRWSSTRNRFAFREEGKKQTTLFTNLLWHIKTELKLNIRIVNGKVNVLIKKWLSQQKYRKVSENLKPVGLSLHSKKLNSPLKPRMLMVPRKKHPSPWYNIHDVSRGSVSYWWIFIVWNFHTRGTQRLFSVKFVGRSKYCLEISQTWERLACSHILYFLF